MLNVNIMRKSLLKAALEGKLTNGDSSQWQKVRLNELVTNNVTFFDGDWILTQDLDNNGSIRLLQLQDIGQGKFLNKSSKYINEETFTRLKCRELHEGDLMISRMADPIARSCILPKLPYKVITAVDVAVVRCDENIISNKFLNYVFNSPYMIETASKMARGTTRLRITRRSLGEILIPLPPLSEQLLIVSKLDSLFECLDNLDKAQRKFQHDREIFRKSILKAALEGKLTGSDSSQWPRVKLGEVVSKHVGGGTPDKSNCDYWNGDINWASVKDLKGDFLESTQDYITQEGIANSSTRIIPAGNIIVCMRMALGKIVINTIDVAINQDLRAFFLRDDVDKKFFFYAFKTLQIKGRGLTVQGITIKELLNYVIPLPPLEEQQRIVSRLDELMSVIDSLADTESIKHVI